MGVSRDDGDASPADSDRELRERVDRELDRFLDSVHEVDLATAFRTLVGLFGAHALPRIADVIATRLHRGDIEIETRCPKPGMSNVAFIRRALARRVAV